MNTDAILSGLTLSLQAEIIDRRKDFNHMKTQKQNSINKINKPLFKKNKQHTNVNNNKHKKNQKHTTDLETEELLAKSQIALQKKSRLYDDMNRIDQSDSGILNSDTCLVDFEQKLVDNEFNEKFTYQAIDEPRNFIGNLGGYSTPYTPSFSSDSKLNEFNAGDSEFLHYQEAIGNEIRQHGVGYFSFSTEESTRRLEMEDLERLHKDTEKNIARRQKELKERKAAKDARMQRVRDEMRRKLTALGRDVSFLDEVEKENAIEIETESTETPEGTERKAISEKEQLDKQKNEVFKLIDSIRESTRQPTIREWDKDKLTISTNRYFADREGERNPEFAPPDSYKKKTRKK